ncbi:branched-chain amino acid ABC transporter substrate-binding protein [Methyloversatilis thermotolerans]|uniref:branched-chain amino acid ABC transporter substrate-binding protein n=1 Tax=Methyloversatilis thermotolerans TaxID=1346290 RepID=UPI00039A3521|nr:branched-chain amino acid ABC transporter substrate-binding protein [Methyloversatilis thermotolerans]
MTQHVPLRPLSVLAAACMLAACGQQSDAPAPSASVAADAGGATLTVRLGHVAPLTGPQAHLGKDNENGAQLAIDDLNAEKMLIGGRVAKFELLGEDDQADPRQGTTVAQKLADAHVHAVIGHLNSGTTIPASRIYHDAHIVQVSPSATNPTYTRQGYKTAFRVFADDVQQGSVLGAFAVSTLGAKKIAIIDDRTAYGQGLADEFEKAARAAGASIVTREYTTDKETDFAAILTKVKSTRPDLVFYGGMDTQAGPMARQIKTLGLAVPMLFGDGGCTVEFHKLAGDAAEGNYCSLPGVPLEQMAGGNAFRERYKAKYNSEIQLYAPYAYDAVRVVAEAMKQAGSTDTDKFLPALAALNYPGLTAQIQFDEKGDIKDGAITLYQAKSGAWQALETMGGKASN